jgi:hypothetical protein
MGRFAVEERQVVIPGFRIAECVPLKLLADHFEVGFWPTFEEFGQKLENVREVGDLGMGSACVAEFADLD